MGYSKDPVESIDGRQISPGRTDSGEFRQFPDQETHHAAAGRPIASTKDRTLYVDPVNGDDSIPSDDVSQTNPLETVQEAINRIPYFVNHEYVIDLTSAASLPVTHGDPNNYAALQTPANVFMGWAISGDNSLIRFEGDTATPANCEMAFNNVSVSLKNPEVEDPGSGANFSGCTFTGAIQAKNGKIGVTDSVFTGAKRDTAIAGKNGDVFLLNCEFQSGLQWAADSISFMRVIFKNCTANVENHVAEVRQGGEVRVVSGRANLNGGLGRWDVTSSGAQVIESDHVVSGRAIMADDFGDGRFTAPRFTGSGAWATGGSGGYRPGWNLSSGSPTVQNGSLRLPAGDTTTQIVNRGQPQLAAEWVIDYQWNADPTAGTASLRVSYGSGNSYWAVRLGNGGDVALAKTEGGAFTGDIIVSSGHDDTNRHTITLSRNRGETWELFVDGASAGNATDAFVPNYDDERDILLVNNADAALDIHNVMVKPFQ